MSETKTTSKILWIDECTKQQMYDLLACLEVPIENMIVEGLTIRELRKEYRAMLTRQLRDWRQGKKYFNSIRIKAR